VVGYGESQQFNITADSGYVSRVLVDGVDQGNIPSYNFTDVQSNHTISVSSVPIGSSTPSTSPSQTQQPTDSTKANQFPIQTVLIAVAAIAAVIALFALAFKKGYITIETEETPSNPQENREIKVFLLNAHCI
jgi:hypothetical protein